jgi:hypothetical protein
MTSKREKGIGIVVLKHQSSEKEGSLTACTIRWMLIVPVQIVTTY